MEDSMSPPPDDPNDDFGNDRMSSDIDQDDAPEFVVNVNSSTTRALAAFREEFDDDQFEIITTSGVDLQCALEAPIATLRAQAKDTANKGIPVPTLIELQQVMEGSVFKAYCAEFNIFNTANLSLDHAAAILHRWGLTYHNVNLQLFAFVQEGEDPYQGYVIDAGVVPDEAFPTYNVFVHNDNAAERDPSVIYSHFSGMRPIFEEQDIFRIKIEEDEHGVGDDDIEGDLEEDIFRIKIEEDEHGVGDDDIEGDFGPENDKNDDNDDQGTDGEAEVDAVSTRQARKANTPRPRRSTRSAALYAEHVSEDDRVEDDDVEEDGVEDNGVEQDSDQANNSGFDSDEEYDELIDNNERLSSAEPSKTNGRVQTGSMDVVIKLEDMSESEGADDNEIEEIDNDIARANAATIAYKSTKFVLRRIRSRQNYRKKEILRIQSLYAQDTNSDIHNSRTDSGISTSASRIVTKEQLDTFDAIHAVHHKMDAEYGDECAILLKARQILLKYQREETAKRRKERRKEDSRREEVIEKRKEKHRKWIAAMNESEKQRYLKRTNEASKKYRKKRYAAMDESAKEQFCKKASEKEMKRYAVKAATDKKWLEQRRTRGRENVRKWRASLDESKEDKHLKRKRAHAREVFAAMNESEKDEYRKRKAANARKLYAARSESEKKKSSEANRNRTAAMSPRERDQYRERRRASSRKYAAAKKARQEATRVVQSEKSSTMDTTSAPHNEPSHQSQHTVSIMPVEPTAEDAAAAKESSKASVPRSSKKRKAQPYIPLKDRKKRRNTKTKKASRSESDSDACYEADGADLDSDEDDQV